MLDAIAPDCLLGLVSLERSALRHELAENAGGIATCISNCRGMVYNTLAPLLKIPKTQKQFDRVVDRLNAYPCQRMLSAIQRRLLNLPRVPLGCECRALRHDCWPSNARGPAAFISNCQGRTCAPCSAVLGNLEAVHTTPLKQRTLDTGQPTPILTPIPTPIPTRFPSKHFFPSGICSGRTLATWTTSIEYPSCANPQLSLQRYLRQRSRIVSCCCSSRGQESTGT